MLEDLLTLGRFGNLQPEARSKARDATIMDVDDTLTTGSERARSPAPDRLLEAYIITRYSVGDGQADTGTRKPKKLGVMRNLGDLPRRCGQSCTKLSM